MDAVMHAPNGETHERRGEIGFAWVLEGRAIQDVWILPDFFYGTTRRVYDPGIDAWHILWSDPLRQFYSQQIGRAHGPDIIQLGKSDDGTDTNSLLAGKIQGISFVGAFECDYWLGI